MKAMAIHCLIILAPLGLAAAAAADEEDIGTEAGFPQFAAGEKRLEILSRLRNDLVAAVKENRLDRMGTLLSEGDGEFGRRIWLSREERLYLYLVLGRGEEIVREEGLRRLFFGAGFYHGYRQAFPRLCPGETEAGHVGSTQLGYAPDLIDHLKNRFVKDRFAILDRLKPHADLHDLVSLARCPDPDRGGKEELTRSDLRILEAFVGKHPHSRLTAEILERSRIGKSWSGNGWLLGLGPAYAWHDEKTASLVEDGFQASLFTDFNFPILKTGIEAQILPFTPRRPFAFDDTVVTAEGASLVRFVFHAGQSFRLARNTYITPYTGIVFSELGLHQADEERLRKKDKTESSVGIPVGANLDYLFILPGGGGPDFLLAFGLRAAFAWHFGNWGEMESGLGDQGAVFGLKLFYAAASSRPD